MEILRRTGLVTSLRSLASTPSGILPTALTICLLCKRLSCRAVRGVKLLESRLVAWGIGEKLVCLIDFLTSGIGLREGAGLMDLEWR